MRASDVGVAAVLLVAGGLVVVTGRLDVSAVSADGAAAGRVVAVSRSELACPGSPGEGDSAPAGTVVMVAPPLPPDTPESTGGRQPARLIELGPPGERLAGLTRRPQAVVSRLPGRPGPTAVATAHGVLAPGLVATQENRANRGDLRGLAAAACLPSASRWWFAGVGSELGRRGRLVLTNVDATAAVVDVRLYGPAGPVRAAGSQGIAVASGTRRVIGLDALAPGQAQLAVEVLTDQGRVVASVRDQWADGLDPAGWDWVPPTLPPATRLVLPGVPAGPGPRELAVVNPSGREALVTVELADESGTFQPSGLPRLRVRPGGVAAVNLAPFTAQLPVAVRLRADHPVAAAVRSTVGRGRDLAEVAFAPAAAPLTAAAVLPTGPATGEVHATLALTGGPTRAASVRAVVRDLAGARVQAASVRVPAGTVRRWGPDDRDLPAAGWYLQVRPRRGQVWGSRILSVADENGPLVTQLPLRSPQLAVRQPAVRSRLMP